MIVDYSGDISTLDQPVLDAASERPNKSIRMRIQPSLFRLREGETAGTGHYRAWSDVSWIVQCETVDETLQLRDTLQLFFAAIAREGLQTVETLLTPAAESST